MAESGNCGFAELFKLPAYITPLLSSGEGIRSPGNGAAEVPVSWAAQESVCKADFNELIRGRGAGGPWELASARHGFKSPARPLTFPGSEQESEGLAFQHCGGQKEHLSDVAK